MVATLSEQLAAWFERAVDCLNQWEDYLDELHQALGLGNWEHLELLLDEGQATREKLQQLEGERQAILEEARGNGIACFSLIRVVEKLQLEGGTDPWRRLERRFQQSHVRLFAAWTQIRCCDEHVQTLLRFFATGHGDGATYIQSERRHLEGGILVDESA
ncbi:MAG: hypothetical protein RLY14_1715 [Planctomycetota bacterium]